MKNALKHFFVLLIVLSSLIFFQKNSIAIVYPFNLSYTGLQEVPPNASPATGTISGIYDDGTKTIAFNISFSGFVGTTTAAHFHAPAAPGVNAPVIIGYASFPLGVTSGVYSNSYVLTAGQEANLLNGLVYSNIHSNIFPGGEIRTQMILDPPLPVNLSAFVSVINRNSVTLSWTTANELNNSGFDIERSSGNGKFLKIGFVPGNGNSNSTNNYSFTDARLNFGTYSYRLKQIDFNGNFEYFSLNNEVNIGTPVTFYMSQNYPNPFNPSTKINYDIPNDGLVKIVLYDLSGKEAGTILNESKTAGYYTAEFNAANLSSGVYFYTITSGNFSLTKKMMLVK